MNRRSFLGAVVAMPAVVYEAWGANDWVEEANYQLMTCPELPYVWGPWEGREDGVLVPRLVRCRDGSRMTVWEWRPGAATNG